MLSWIIRILELLRTALFCIAVDIELAENHFVFGNEHTENLERTDDFDIALEADA